MPWGCKPDRSVARNISSNDDQVSNRRLTSLTGTNFIWESVDPLRIMSLSKNGMVQRLKVSCLLRWWQEIVALE